MIALEPRHTAWLLGLVVIASLLFPPEVYPEVGALCGLVLAAALILSQASIRWGPLLVIALGVAVNLACSLAPARSVGFLLRLALPMAAFCVARTLESGERTKLYLAAMIGGAALSCWAIVQKFWLLPYYANRARLEGAASEVLTRLENGRVFAGHAVPAALAGALVLTAAAAWVLTNDARYRRWAQVALCLIAVAFVMTGSLGALLSVLPAGALLVWPEWRRARRVVQLGSLATLVGVALLLLAMRPVSAVDFSRPDNPLKLRIGNWRAAVMIGMQQPFVGTGLGSYGALMPQVRQVGDQETLYAHNSWLQLAVECGLPAVVVMALGALWLLRRWRYVAQAEQRWALAAVTAFVIHNLFDFSLFLPGVAITAAVFAGMIVTRDLGRTSATRVLPTCAVALALVAMMWGCEAWARLALSSGHPGVAARAAPWSVQVGQRAFDQLIEDRQFAPAEALARVWIERDPASPAAWKMAGLARLEARDPGGAWHDWEVSVSRHRADRELLDRMHQLEDQFRAAGMLSGDLMYGEPSAPRRFGWETWDTLLLLIALAAAVLGFVRRPQPRQAPPEALLLTVVLILVPWGEGGALPGAQLGRAILILAALAICLFPWHAPRHSAAPREWPLTPVWLLLPAACAVLLSTALSVDGAAARDGLGALLQAGILLVLSWDLARRFAAWPRVVVTLFAFAMALVTVVWLMQQLGLALNFDLSRAVGPLRLPAGMRPAADLLHPGHAGTMMVAGGLAAIGFALFSAGQWWRIALGLGLVTCGLAGGARGSLVALLCGGVLLAWLSADPRLRRWILLGLGLFVLAASAAIVWRFRAGDPYMWRRVEIWRAALDAIGDRWVVGFGPGAFAAVAPTYRFDDPGPVAHFGRTFTGPHSDLLGAFLASGIVGGVLLIALLTVLLYRGLRTTRLAHQSDPALAGGAAAVVALFGHAVVDDLFSERPAAVVAMVLLLGALCGGRLERQRLWTPSRGARSAIMVAALVTVLSIEVIPWAADRWMRAGQPLRAAKLDSRRAEYWIAAARGVDGDPLPRLARALDRVTWAVQARPQVAAGWAERAQLLEAACRGLLPERTICHEALQSWQRVVDLAPRDAPARFALARLADATGDAARARAELERAISDEPNFLSARLALGHLLLRQADREGAREQLRQVQQRAQQLDGVRPESSYESTLLDVAPGAWTQLRDKL
jgi:O-antigen ligase